MKTIMENDIAYIIRGAIFKIYNATGPGLLESAYVQMLVYELQNEDLTVKTEVPVPLIYDNIKRDFGYRMDILVNDLVIVEVKSVEAIAAVHHKQLMTYLKLSNKRLGLLVNFNTDDLSRSIIRKVNKLPEAG